MAKNDEDKQKQERPQLLSRKRTLDVVKVDPASTLKGDNKIEKHHQRRLVRARQEEDRVLEGAFRVGGFSMPV